MECEGLSMLARDEGFKAPHPFLFLLGFAFFFWCFLGACAVCMPPPSGHAGGDEQLLSYPLLGHSSRHSASPNHPTCPCLLSPLIAALLPNSSQLSSHTPHSSSTCIGPSPPFLLFGSHSVPTPTFGRAPPTNNHNNNSNKEGVP